MAKKSTSTEKYIVGLDIGTTKIATVVGYMDKENQINIIGWGKSKSTGIRWGEIFNILRTQEAIRDSVESASERAGIEINEAYAGIAGHHIKTSRYSHHLYRHGNNEHITEDEIKNFIEEVKKINVDPGEQIIDVIPQNYQLDGGMSTNEPVGCLANDVVGTFQIITGKDSEIQKIITCSRNAEVEPKEIILEPIASAIACLTEEEKKGGVALLDIGGGTSDLIIYVDGSPVFTKVIPIGGTIVTKDISKICKISEDKAEEVKVKYGSAIPEKTNKNSLITITQDINSGTPVTQISEYSLSQIINCRIDTDILERVSKAIESSGYGDKLFNGLVLTGGGSQLKYLKEFCQYKLGLNTRIGQPNQGFDKNIDSELKSPMFSTALGLLKFGILAEMDEDEKLGNNKIKSSTGGHVAHKQKFGVLDTIHEWLKNVVNVNDTIS